MVNECLRSTRKSVVVVWHHWHRCPDKIPETLLNPKFRSIVASLRFDYFYLLILQPLSELWCALWDSGAEDVMRTLVLSGHNSWKEYSQTEKRHLCTVVWLRASLYYSFSRFSGSVHLSSLPASVFPLTSKVNLTLCLCFAQCPPVSGKSSRL